MLKIGLTGGIGSGKTTVANLFAELGVPIIDTDQIARALVAPHTPAWEKITEHFNHDYLLIDEGTQEINRRELRQRVFNNPLEKKWLENLLHPLIREETLRQMNLITEDYCIVVIPLLIESEHDYHLDRILVVDTAPEMQIKRVSERDQVPEEQVQQIISAQVSRDERLQHADDIIENTHIALDQLRNKVQTLHQHYLSLASPPF